MSGGLAAVLGGIQGFADGRAIRKGREREERILGQQDRMLDIMEKNPGAFSGGYGINGFAPGAYGGRYDGQGSGYGIAAPGSNIPSEGGSNGTAALFALTDRTEGGGNYDTLYGHSQRGGRFDGVRVSDMTLDQLYDFSNPSGAYGQWVAGEVGRVATPMGRHQIVGTTLRAAAEGMGLSGDTKFTPQIQDSMAAYLARNRLAGAKSPAAKRAALRSEWEGFRGVSDDALDAAIAEFEASGGYLTNRPMGIGPT